MTRLLARILAFYRRWLSPALHSLSPGGCRFVPTCSEYAASGDCHARPIARDRPGDRGACCAAIRSAAEALTRCRPQPRNSFAARTITIDRAARLSVALLNDRKFPLPEFRNPNLRIAGLRRRRQRGGGDFRSLMIFMLARGCGLSWLSVLQAEAGANASRRSTRRSSPRNRAAEPAPAPATTSAAASGRHGARRARRLQRSPLQPRPRPRSRTRSTGSSSPIAARR